MLHFQIDTTPIAKGRPRYAKRGNFVQTYTPKTTVVYETLIRENAKLAMGSSEPLETPLNVLLMFGMPIPSSTPKKLLEGYLNGSIPHIKKPDVDNLAKSVLDAMNGVVYVDDCKIVRLTIEKKYSKLPFVSISIRENLE
jgi:Holliday junction resolvase RusA-like endonuclease